MLQSDRWVRLKPAAAKEPAFRHELERRRRGYANKPHPSASRIIGDGVMLKQPASASRRAAALRKPCAQHGDGSPAALHALRNQFENETAPNGLPPFVTRNVRFSRCVPAMTSASRGCTGMESSSEPRGELALVSGTAYRKDDIIRVAQQLLGKLPR